MESLLIILGLIAVGVAVVIILQKTGKIKDADGDLIPDAIEEKVEEAKEVVNEVKTRAKRVTKEAKEVVETTKKVVKEVKDVVDAAKGVEKPKAKRGRKPKTTK
jgi:gas vesicle protein